MAKILPILLSAGMGTRLTSENPNTPKSLIKINGKPLIYFQLEYLEQIGFKEVLIIIGFEAKTMIERVGDYSGNLKINYIENSEYKKSGSALSFLKAKPLWEKYRCSILMLHADLFYDSKIIYELIKFKNKNIIVTDYAYKNLTNDEMVVFADGKSVSKIIKGPKDAKDSVGESLGINLFTDEFCQKYFEYLESLLITNESKKLNWEQTIQGFVSKNAICNLEHAGINCKEWININYQEDLDHAKNNIYHKLYNDFQSNKVNI